MKYAFLFAVVFLLGCKTKQTTSEKKIPCEHGEMTVKREPASGEYSIVSGTVIDASTKELLPFVRVLLYQNGSGVYGAETDVDGHFKIDKVKSGSYTLRINHMGYSQMELSLQFDSPTHATVDIAMVEERIFVEKPVIYLYPQEPTEVHVRLDYQGKLMHTYPAYPAGGWKVTAHPDGSLWDEKGQEYYALFWEGMSFSSLKAEDGFVVAGKETAAFLEEKLTYLGLSRREANEFIMYWLPRMEHNPYNLIHFAGEDYNQLAPLHISPTPQTIIRVMMLTKPLNEKINIPLQDLTPLKKSRSGFTVVEWGGQVLG